MKKNFNLINELKKLINKFNSKIIKNKMFTNIILNTIILLIIVIICIIIKILYNKFTGSEGLDDKSDEKSDKKDDKLDEEKIKTITDNILKKITDGKNINDIINHFCKKDNENIREYFEYFTNIPGIKITNKTYNVMKISDEIYTNTAYVTWEWDNIAEPLNTKIILTFKGECIFQLFSDELPKK